MKNIKTFFVFFILVFSSTTFAASVTAVKGKKIMINLEGESTAPGSEFFVLSPNGKKVAIVRITQIKGDRALADILKGAVRMGYSLQARGGGGGASTSSSADSYYDKKLSARAHTGNSMGVVGGYLMNSMLASFMGGPLGATYKVEASMSGSGFGALGFYDYAISPRFAFRGMTGVEQYNVAGSINTPDCTQTTICDVQLMYLSFYGYGKYNLLMDNHKWWIGGGYGYLYALSKASSVLRADQISANQVFVLSTGFDYRLSAKNYVPISLEYGIYPSSASVKATILYLRAGYAWNL